MSSNEREIAARETRSTFLTPMVISLISMVATSTIELLNAG